MQLEQGFSLKAAPEAVWAAFHDVELLVDCLPGASIRSGSEPIVVGADMPLLFKVKLGPIAAGFAGQGRLLLDETQRTGVFSGGAVDAKTSSRVKGEARFALLPADDGTRVTLSVDYTVTGALAQFSREGIARALAEQLTRQFADNLQVRLQQTAAVVPEPAAGSNLSKLAPLGKTTSASQAGAALRHPDNSSIDLWSLFKVWLRGLFAPRRR